jgi:pimeloyl-ACP methyl ester carboxylesterase
MREVFIANAPTFLDEVRDPDALQMDLEALARFDKAALVTRGTDSAPFFGPVVDMIADRLPHCERVTISGADHLPHISVSERYVELVQNSARARFSTPG